jgi:hypothetical protein
MEEAGIYVHLKPFLQIVLIPPISIASATVLKKHIGFVSVQCTDAIL